jgi:hypothetical protein
LKKDNVLKTVPTIESTPRKVQWSDLREVDELDDRVGAVTVLFGSVIGVNAGYVSWCPDDSPPTEQERLAWIWLCNPTLDTQILPFTKGDLRDLLIAYRAGDLQQWWIDLINAAHES